MDDSIGIMKRVKEQVSAQVKVLRLEPGDILVAKLGIVDMGEGLPPWIPSVTDLEHMLDDLSMVIPKDVKVFVSHMGLEFEIVRDLSEADRVLVETIDKDKL